MSEDTKSTVEMPQSPATTPQTEQVKTAPAEGDDRTLLGAEGQTDDDLSYGEADGEPEGKEGEEKSIVPEKYDFKVPEGMSLNEGLVESMTPVFKELGLTQEQAQKLVDAYAPQIKATAEAQQQASISEFHKIVAGWKVETQKALGADVKTTLALCSKAINKFGTPELRTLLNETGSGNHIELVKFMAKVGELISEDKFVDSSTRPPKDADSLMYPSMAKK